MAQRREAQDLIRGAMDVLILRSLDAQPLSGVEVADWIDARTEGELRPGDAGLYQALHRLERKGFLLSEWGVNAEGRRAKYYDLSSLGRERLESELHAWSRYMGAMRRVIEP